MTNIFYIENYQKINKLKRFSTAALTKRISNQFDILLEIKFKKTFNFLQNQLRRENEMFMKYHEMIREERKKQNAEMSKMILKQMNEMEELKRSMERKTDEKRQKQVEVRNTKNHHHLILITHIHLIASNPRFIKMMVILGRK